MFKVRIINLLKPAKCSNFSNFFPINIITFPTIHNINSKAIIMKAFPRFCPTNNMAVFSAALII